MYTKNRRSIIQKSHFGANWDSPSSQSLIPEYMAPVMRTRKRRRTAREKLGVHGRRCALFDSRGKYTKGSKNRVSTFEVGLVRCLYDEQLALLSFLVHLLVCESADFVFEMPFRRRQQEFRREQLMVQKSARDD